MALMVLVVNLVVFQAAMLAITAPLGGRDLSRVSSP
jgi:hypothetical protein